jgi:hypothetical protein
MSMKKYEVTLFVLGLPYSPNRTRTEIIEANSQDEAEQKAHDWYASDGWGVYGSREYREGLTQEQVEGVKYRVDYVLGYLFTDSLERSAVIDRIIDPVIQDIEETAGWQELAEDDYCDGDIGIAMARVLYGIIVGE